MPAHMVHLVFPLLTSWHTGKTPRAYLPTHQELFLQRHTLALHDPTFDTVFVRTTVERPKA
jgi:hypothetical protein